VSVYWADELGQTTQGEPVFAQNILTAKRLSGRASASIEAIEDSVIGLIPYIQNVMAERMGKELDQEALEGDGTNFTGLNAESGINSVSTTTTGGEEIAYIDLVKAVYAADESSVEDGSAWFMHRKMLATVVALVDTTGNPIFQPSIAGGVPNTILGFPVYTTSAIDNSRLRNAETTSNVYFGNPRRLIFGDRMGMRFDVTDTGPNWEYFAVDMRINGRWGFTVGTPAAFSVIVGGKPIQEW
jgi:HK97 family phage major capsid protein